MKTFQPRKQKKKQKKTNKIDRGKDDSKKRKWKMIGFNFFFFFLYSGGGVVWKSNACQAGIMCI